MQTSFLPHVLRGRLIATGSRQDGVVTAFTVVLLAGLIVLAGLVFDGGMAMKGRVQALDEAQEAARAGAQQIDVPAFRATGQAVLDPGPAVTAAEDYLAATGDTGTVAVDGDTVTVTVTHVQHTEILAVIGIGSFTEHATASATAEQGG
ncbi:MAG TPA: pilus assembly protein TadG-related protein [Actinocrinis sp.]|nr:pilus assembly protein TadG-related protein [Actinocrinis sp.]